MITESSLVMSILFIDNCYTIYSFPPCVNRFQLNLSISIKFNLNNQDFKDSLEIGYEKFISRN